MSDSLKGILKKIEFYSVALDESKDMADHTSSLSLTEQ